MSRIGYDLTDSEARRRAREMYQGGWKVSEIRTYLAARGISRNWSTIKRWVDDETRKRHVAYQRQWWARTKDRRHPIHAFRTWDETAARHAVLALRAEGLSLNAIVKAIRVMAGLELDRARVRRILDDGAVA